MLPQYIKRKIISYKISAPSFFFFFFSHRSMLLFSLLYLYYSSLLVITVWILAQSVLESLPISVNFPSCC